MLQRGYPLDLGRFEPILAMFANDDFGGGIGRRRRPKKSLLLSLLSSHRGNSVIRMKTFQFNQKPSVANLAIETKHCNCDMMTFFENKSENSEKISEKSKHRVKEFIYI